MPVSVASGTLCITNSKIGIYTNMITVMDLKTMGEQNSQNPSHFLPGLGSHF